MKKYVFGFDVGGTTVKIGLFSLRGELINKWEIPTDTSNRGRGILKDIYTAIKTQNICLDEVLGYGFGIPCQIKNGLILDGVNVEWKDYDVVKEFSKLVNNNFVLIDNDANVAALGETWMGAAKGHKNAVMITLGTGVGGGVIVNSKVVNGAHGSGGEIGHLQVVPENGVLCNCGNYGCLETIASATGIKNSFRELQTTKKTNLIFEDNENITAKKIFDAAKKGDPLCLEVVDKTAYYLGYACQLLSVVTNPSVITIGGGVSNSGEFLIDKIRNEFKKRAFSTVKDTLIVQASLGNDAGIYGAASLIIND